ncbi:MAG: Lyzozyme M1 (1,4-beta-N-acetylmuramidase), partial [Butyrivibrio sp.]|nr:Lyzozyme M1 (1,4-beta-N-acetylmuramidase) [Butyrivibrio sp.]
TDEYETVAKTFCDMVKQAGYTPMIYGNVKSFTLLMDAVDVDDYDIWIAYYGLPMYYPYHFNIWQYTSSGRIDGIDGDVDLNICITDY